MTHHKPSSNVPTHRVNWSDPRLVPLLQKIESWQIDNRGTYPRQDLHIQFGPGDGTSETAVLVWENEDAMVLQTFFPIQQGEEVRVDKPFGDEVQALWGAVIESRTGHRTDDGPNGVLVHWLRKH